MSTKRERIAELAKLEYATLSTINANQQRNVGGMDYDEREQFHVEQTLLRSDLIDIQRKIQNELNSIEE
jgi:hypothetical protein